MKNILLINKKKGLCIICYFCSSNKVLAKHFNVQYKKKKRERNYSSAFRSNIKIFYYCHIKQSF